MTSLAEAVAPWRAPKQDELLMLTLYAHPPDWPRHYVIRAMYVGGAQVSASAKTAIFRTGQEAQDWIAECYPGLKYKGRYTDDEPQVLGVWL